MPCNNCNACSCRVVQTTSISVVDGALVLAIPNDNYTNHQMVCISLIVSDVNSQVPPIPVKIGLGGTDTTADIITENGNYLYTDQLYRNRILRLMVATDSALFVKRGCFKRTSVVFPEPLVVEDNTESDNSTEG